MASLNSTNFEEETVDEGGSDITELDSSSVKLYIDSRERELKEYFQNVDPENIIVKNLDLGDIVFKKGEEIILIIERKIVSDLSASICDGRHKEQKARLMGSGISKKRIMYLVEGNISISTTIKGGTSTLVGSVINTQFRDGIRLYKTNSLKETIFFLERLFEKLKREHESFFKYDENHESISTSDYATTLKTKKRANMSSKVWFTTSLMLIPQLTAKVADVIIEKYASIHLLVNEYNTLPGTKEKCSLLQDLTYISTTGKKRRIGPALSTKVYEFIYDL